MNEIESTEVIERDNLAIVAMVERLEPIPLKDRIELVFLKNLGYTCVCEKGHKVGDLVMFVKYDTIVPKNELFDFMHESKFRVKSKSFTERDEEDNVIKKIYSQGIVLPMRKVREFLSTTTEGNSKLIYDIVENNNLWEVGFDLTEVLGVKKYIPPAANGGSSLGQMQSKGDFPTHLLSKTDEDNLASRMSALFELQGKDVYFSLKSEGSSCTVFADPESADAELNVCTRNNNIREVEGSKFWQAVNKHNLKENLKQFPNIAVQAELVGPKIQANHHGLDDVDLHVFTMTDITDNRRRLSLTELQWTTNALGMKMVKVVYTSEDFQIVPNIENDDWDPNKDYVDSRTIWTYDRLQKFADIQVYDNGSPAEGIVIRPCEPFVSQKLKTLWSGKIINRNYKL